MSQKFYVTTPIYYANGKPHIGNSYTSFIADLYARTKRMLWYEVKFATGTDENGQKMTTKAAEEGKEVMDYLDWVAAVHKETRDACGISYTDFIRTTEPRHKEYVQKMLQITYDNWDIYQGEYEWMYCVWCEGFKKEWDLVEYEWKNVCPDHLVVPDTIKEKNWFFRLSKYEEKLKELYKENEKFCSPRSRFNEINSFVEQGLEDFSISREWSNFGIWLPFDNDSVTYIWFDALYNYLTVCQWWDEAFWDEWEVVHILWKDISRFHAIFWPAMLMSSWNILPTREVINWFFTIDGQKMSKSLGNIFYPDELIVEHWRDALVYYLFSDIKIGNDWDFSWDRFEVTKEATLKKWRGNLVSRVVTLCKKQDVNQWKVDIESFKIFAKEQEVESFLLDALVSWKMNDENVNLYIDNNKITLLLRDRFQLVQLWNKFVDETKPREKAKTDSEWAKKDLQTLLRLIKWIAVLSAPFLIESFEKFQNIVQIDHESRKLLQTTENNSKLWDNFSEILSLQDFYTSRWESKYLY